MKRFLLRLVPLAALVFAMNGHISRTAGQPGPTAAPEKKFEEFDKIVKGAKETEGLFKLYQKEDNLFAEIRPDQLDKPFLCPIAIARGLGMGGHTLNFDEQWVLVFKRVNDRIQVIRRNVHFTAKPGSPAAKAVDTTYADSILLAVRIRSIHPNKQSILINLNDIFMSDFADLGLGYLDTTRSSWNKVKAFPRNIEIEVMATFAGGRRSGGDAVIDSRGNTVVIHYGLCQMPDAGYQPRHADDRVGHFLTAFKDFSSDSQETTFVRYINRWRLERAEPLDPKNPNKLSSPKKKIVYWIEKSVPEEYRAAVREGILEWNKAFEKIGFRDAIEVRQQENEDFDPEDISYNTFRWIASDRGFAMGPSRANPLTGEILDADIIFDASMVRFWKQESKLFQNGRPASLIQATREGYGFESLPTLPGQHLEADQPQGWNEEPKDPDAARKRARMLAARQGACQCGAQMRYELGLAAMAASARGYVKPGELVPEELVQQAIKHVVMHEVGHTLGLRHNFKGSTFLKNEQLHDTKITREKGLIGSVMDYASPVNLSGPSGVKQGDYYSTTIGPYDYWEVIEYALTSRWPAAPTEKSRSCVKSRRRAAQPGHDYLTDEDMFGTSDPLVHVWDLGADPMKFGMERIALADELIKGLADRVVEKGDGYQRARTAFNVLLGQYANGTYLVAAFVGGEHMHRDHRDDPNARDPFEPVKGAKQREALKFLQEHVLSDKSFQFPPALLRKLAADRWSHWGDDSPLTVDYPLNERVLRIQTTALNHLYNPLVLARIQNNATKAEKDEKPLEIAEIFRATTDGIWGDLGVKGSCRTARRRWRRRCCVAICNGEHALRRLTGGRGHRSRPSETRSLARACTCANWGGKIQVVAQRQGELKLDDTTRAHLEESSGTHRASVLKASVHISETVTAEPARSRALTGKLVARSRLVLLIIRT